MSSKTGKQLVPALRFPEFRDAVAWEEKKLGDVCEILNNRRKPVSSADRVIGAYPYYGASGIVDYINDYLFDEDLVLVGEDGAKWGAQENTAFMARGKFWVNNHAHVLKPIGVADELLVNYLTMLDLSPFVTGAAPPKLTLGKLKTVPLLLPPEFSEQKKLANCLSSIDDLIATQAKKIEALKAHKKGLVQQFFPAEGETGPRLRFPEFRDGPEWIPATLGDVSTIKSGGTPSRTNPDYWGGTIPWVTTSLIDSKIIFNVDEHITKLGLEGSSAKIFPKGTILMAMYGQGKTRGKVAVLGIDAATNQACAAILMKKKVEASFVFQNLASRYEEIRRISNPGGQENLSAGLIESIPIVYPENQKEQKRITSCLSFFDELITAQTQKIEVMKTQKQGLMQGLFPSTNKAEA